MWRAVINNHLDATVDNCIMIELTKDDIFLPTYRGQLVEGIKYDKRTNKLLWVDIHLSQLHTISLAHPDEAHHKVLHFPQDRTTTIGFTDDPNIMIIGAKYGLAEVNLITQSFQYLVKYPKTENTENVKSNEGKIDPWGHFIIGTFADLGVEWTEIGKLYRISPDLKIDTILNHATIPNGMGWSTDRKTFYWCDSFTFTIWKFDIIDGRPTNKTKFFNFVENPVDGIPTGPEGIIGPDGMFVVNDEIFVACYFGSSVVRIDCRTGNVIEVYKVPAALVVCVTVGGINGDEMFITTCNDKAHDFDFGEQDLGGHIFKHKLDKPAPEPNHIWGSGVVN